MNLKQLNYDININASKEEVYNCLMYMTENRFNGTTGKKYLVPVKTDMGTVMMSELDRAMLLYNDNISVKDFINHVLNLNYSQKEYFNDYEIFMIEVYDTLVISVAVTYEY